MRPFPDEVHASHAHEVTAQDSAQRWGNDVPVLATPVLLWLGEITAMRAVERYLEEDEMTVGVSHDSRHLAPTPVGRTVVLQAALRERRGGTLVFDVHGHDGVEEVLRGTHTRAVVDRGRFLARIAWKEQPAAACDA
ncbi:thioesterase family protein [Nonomuraea candida]|uniref:thioesterase family protein n=1 Tax=Nonomuraea candida TaxID=359159 RepID=UPI000694076E|nr:hypothetical protein [Nonomuraea candida]